MADGIRSLRMAIFAIVTADVTVQDLVGRNTRLISSWKALTLDRALPAIAFHLDGFDQTGKDQDTRRGTVRLAAFAGGSGALAKVESIVARLEALISQPALLAQGIDATPLDIRRMYPSVHDGGDESTESERQDSRGVERADVWIDLEFTQAAA